MKPNQNRSPEDHRHPSTESAQPQRGGFAEGPSALPTASYTRSPGEPATPLVGTAVHCTPTFFPNAREFRLDKLEYNHTEHHIHNGPKQSTRASEASEGWKMLVEKTAPNALYNSSARFDPPKCDEDTRLEVINEIMGWIQDRDAPTQILCMTGAAGSGKSALQQTVSERCASLGILAASFFFNAGDSTRNNVSRIVPTIAYQLGHKIPGLRQLIGLAVEDDPLIFDTVLKTQMEALIVGPVHHFLANNSSLSETLPFALLIDGLDECNCLLRGRTPFRIFLASRPEMAIYEALHEPGHLHNAAYHIRLSDDYDATGDIRRSVQRRLQELGLRRKLRKGWFSDSDVKAIVEAASGQYIYAATVTRYISEPRGSPAERLRAVLTWAPGDCQKAKAFASLDALYRNIVLNAQQAFDKTDEHGRDFLLLLRCIIWDISRPLCLQERVYLLDIEVILCDLRSLLDKKHDLLNIYHNSFQEFMADPERAGPVYVYPGRAIEYQLKCCLDRISKIPLEDFNKEYQQASRLSSLVARKRLYLSKDQFDLLEVCATVLVDMEKTRFLKESFAEMLVPFIANDGLDKIDKWFRAPEYGDPAPQFFYMLDDYAASRLHFYYWNWRNGYCSWLLSQLQDFAPELAIVVRKYDGLWNTWWQENAGPLFD
ncbi:hypothetical protein D9611_003745 [Ephemerocybe angulata]|uniref:Nephrocystin 3-like N-terminal domain-containing protein n=1 Tax=Ephemerocybe angulata TaxID=980116 RepID=A0A8H5B5M3_9AGAR|nr:hypothetical protein D9611_003745 [Tulosesus angulatus]